MENEQDIKKTFDQGGLNENPESAEDMKERLDETDLPEERTDETLEKEKLLQKEYTFLFEWEDGNGKVWKGEFTNQILDIKTQQMVGVMRARMGRGMPIESLPEITNEINLMVAHMTYSLSERPGWAKSLDDLTDIALLQAIYMEVAKHDATFHGRIVD